MLTTLKELAGIMPCQHVSVAISVATSGASGSGSVGTVSGNKGSFEHHAILDVYAPNGACYIHVSSIGSAAGEMRVTRTPKRVFERECVAKPRILAEPASHEEAHQILDRARDMIDGPNQGVWEYNILTNNCEHFVRQCWTGDENARSQQVQDTAATLGGSGAFGMLTAGVGTALPVAGLTTTVETVTSVPFLWWSTTTTAPTVVPALSAAAVVAIASGAAVLGGLATVAVGFGTRRRLARLRAAIAELVPVAIKNQSTRPIKAFLSNLDGLVPGLENALHRWRAKLDVGAMSCEISPGMFGELNPATDQDTSPMSRRFELTVEGQTLEVCRGDVLVFEGGHLEKVAIPRCTICLDRPCNVVLQPCGHSEICDQCSQQLARGDGTPYNCPVCREPVEKVERDENI